MKYTQLRTSPICAIKVLFWSPFSTTMALLVNELSSSAWIFMYTKGSQTPNSKRIMPPATTFFTKIDSPCFRPRLEAKGVLEAEFEFEFTVNGEWWLVLLLDWSAGCFWFFLEDDDVDDLGLRPRPPSLVLVAACSVVVEILVNPRLFK